MPRFRELFGCQSLSLVTNGYGVERYREIIERHFDEIHFSDYGNQPAARQVLTQIIAAAPRPFHIHEAGDGAAKFIPRAHRGGGQPCVRAYGESVMYADGLLYGCTVGPGHDGSVGIVPGPDWREKIRANGTMPCADCWFSV